MGFDASTLSLAVVAVVVLLLLVVTPAFVALVLPFGLPLTSAIGILQLTGALLLPSLLLLPLLRTSRSDPLDPDYGGD